MIIPKIAKCITVRVRAGGASVKFRDGIEVGKVHRTHHRRREIYRCEPTLGFAPRLVGKQHVKQGRLVWGLWEHWTADTDDGRLVGKAPPKDGKPTAVLLKIECQLRPSVWATVQAEGYEGSPMLQRTSSFTHLLSGRGESVRDWYMTLPADGAVWCTLEENGKAAALQLGWDGFCVEARFAALEAAS